MEAGTMSIRVLWLAVALVTLSCGPAQSPGAGEIDRGIAGKKRLVAVINGDPPTLSPPINRASLAFSVPGDGELRRLVNVGLTIASTDGSLRPALAEKVPATDNGLWLVFPDGRMETTWTIKPNALWHDGRPVTAEDFVFTATVEQDRDLAVFRDVAYDSLETLDAPDPRTVRARWKRPYIEAEGMFSSPIPKHLFERPYLEEKAAFLQVPYWGEQFVGTGPFALQEFVKGSHVLLRANHAYVLGRPRFDEVEVRFIPDVNTVMANLLAGTVNLTMGRSLNIEQAVQIRDQWRDGRMEMGDFTSWVTIYPQMLTPSPPIVADPRFRRALLHAIDRDQMVEALQWGMVPVGHSFIGPSAPESRAVEGRVVRYDYDPRKAIQMLEGIGYSKGPSGAFTGATGQNLQLEIRVTARNPLSNKALFAVADYWQSIGLAVEPVVIPTQRVTDQEYLHTYPAFMVYRQGTGVSSFRNHHSSRAPVPENGFVGSNYARYMNSEFDALIEKVFTTIPLPERLQVIGQVAHHISDQLNLMGLFYDGQPVLIDNAIQNVTTENQGWNAHEWDWRKG